MFCVKDTQYNGKRIVNVVMTCSMLYKCMYTFEFMIQNILFEVQIQDDVGKIETVIFFF